MDDNHTDHLRDPSTVQEVKSPANISAERSEICEREYQDRDTACLPAEARQRSRPLYGGLMIMSSRSLRSRR